MPHQPAPFGRRLLARLIDLAFALLLTFVVAVPMTIVLLVISAFLPVTTPESADSVGFAMAAVCYVIGYVAIEVFLLVRRDGQTLGKGLMGLRVVTTGSTPAALPIGAATIRMLIIFIPLALGSAAGGNPDSQLLDVLATLGFLSFLVSCVLAALPTTRRAAVHDLAAGSRVVRAPKRSINWATDARMLVPGRIDLTKRV